MSAAPHEDAAHHMDGIYRYQRYIYDLSRKYFLFGRDTMLDGLKPPPSASVLEVGCGTGRNLILAARRYPDAHFYGFDISRMMLETAEANIARAGFEKRIKVVEGDATNFSAQELFGVPAFDRIFISYSLSMIPPWQQVLPQAIDALKPGGSLHIVDFSEQTGLPRWFKSALRAWLKKFSVEPRAELEAELRRVAEEKGCTVTFERLFGDYAHLAVVIKR
ncbi:Type 11 methyltransferase [Candidatus Filomicrobium marinum]|uniref:Type 11 methyltransferase n=2 Tax=Filomicrobium TaxID=119044 RepID=A0A0D6JFB5_9HYPH|nr:Type 11 methyltransferase [Candidatus Filomicrobium marinum]CPR19386.1 Type 11 methyltransferase [Candidatus Filomicrobium marinum]SDO07681.1 S-adenosylmethionine-diacylgycerolhomoserine-N-methlytransferase [Filomicrobium insigne]